MKKYMFSKEICYSKRLKRRTHLKYALTCSLSVLFSAGLVVGLTLGVVHNNNYTGQGGLDYPAIINMKPDYIDTSELDDPIAPVEADAVEAVAEVADVDSEVVESLELSLDEVSLDTKEIGLVAEDSSVDYVTPVEEAVVTNSKQEKDSPLYYTVYRLKKDETASKVASAFKISTDTILSVNGVANATRMSIGTYLRIPSLDGILYEVSREGETLAEIVKSENKKKKINLETDFIAEINNIDKYQSLSVGHTLFLAGDKLTNEQRAEISGTSFRNPLKNSYYISSPFGWRMNPFNASKRSYHNGVDMACPTGTPIYASSAGTVVISGYTSVYGQYVVIKHVNGYKTLYGHMSARNVVVGQYVDQGTIIGKVGSTGQSTGPHLHFTLYKNEKAISPYEKVAL